MVMLILSDNRLTDKVMTINNKWALIGEHVLLIATTVWNVIKLLPENVHLICCNLTRLISTCE